MAVWQSDRVSYLQCDILQCDIVTLWQYTIVIFLPCDSVTLWKFKSVTFLQCEILTFLQYYSMTQWQCEILTFWHCDSVRVWQCESLSVWRYDSVTVHCGVKTGQVAKVYFCDWNTQNTISTGTFQGFYLLKVSSFFNPWKEPDFFVISWDQLTSHRIRNCKIISNCTRQCVTYLPGL